MALDGLVIHSIVNELSSKLIGGKIDKIYQPEDDEIVLHIRNNKENYKLGLLMKDIDYLFLICKKKKHPLLKGFKKVSNGKAYVFKNVEIVSGYLKSKATSLASASFSKLSPTTDFCRTIF